MFWEGGHSIKKMSNHDLLVVAGVGGFVGGHLVKKLREDGFEKIRAVDQKPISEWYAVFDDVENLSLDLKKAEACRTGTKGAASVYNLAAHMGGMGFIDDCVKGTLGAFDQIAGRNGTNLPVDLRSNGHQGSRP
jgi:nucleoside-diphosphate-sugar epimerase